MVIISIETTQEKAPQLLNIRIESVTALVKARQRIADLKEQLTEAEREDKRAYVRATRDGWSEEELQKLGLETLPPNTASAVHHSRRNRRGRTTQQTKPSDPSAQGPTGRQ